MRFGISPFVKMAHLTAVTRLATLTAPVPAWTVMIEMHICDAKQ